MTKVDCSWVSELGDPSNQEAVASLRALVLRGLRSALRHRSDVSEAQLEDFAQEATLRVIQRRSQFNGRSRFSTWVHAIAINTALSELRRRRWQDVSLDAIGKETEEWTWGNLDLPPDPARRTESQRLLDVLSHAIEHRLTTRQRAAIVAELRGVPFDQIAAQLGTNRNAAYKMLHDARRALKSHLESEGISVEEIRVIFAP